MTDAAVICSLQGPYADHPFPACLHDLLPDCAHAVPVHAVPVHAVLGGAEQEP